jgi:hypothetical protein
MRATITRIDSKKKGNGAEFQRIYFKMDPAPKLQSLWAKTDLCKGYRNYSRWSHLLKVGNTLDGLEMKTFQTVDADCHPRLVPPPPAAPVQVQLL